MSDILIRGMEMPKSCDDCRLNNGITCYAVPEYTEDGVVGRTDDRPDWCPLVQIPPNVINFDKPYTFTISWDGEQLKGNICGSAI